jgi:acyl-CoA dehydrogenase
LHVLYASWLVDKHRTYNREVRREIAAVKSAMPGVLRDVVYRSLHLHGALGMSNEMPLMEMWATVPEMGIVDGPTEVHQMAVAKAVLRDRSAARGLWPTYFLPDAIASAREKLAQAIELDVQDSY